MVTPRSCSVAAALAIGFLLLPRGEARAGGEPADRFRAHGVEGAFVLLDTETGKLTLLHDRVARRRYIPQSTFKIANTLIGLETGVIPDEHFSLRWDGVQREVPDWNRDQDLASAMKFSVVWFYQEVARRIGKERMTAWVKKLGYGNRTIAGGAIDRFWLDGPLRISPVEQVDFLRRLCAGNLPVEREHADLVLRLIELERGPNWVLRGKTGLGRDHDRAIGWLVGVVERDGRRSIYATVMFGESTDQLKPLRRPITEELLRQYGVLPPASPRSP
ncbi:MAG TPA: penicillin-binding transpeptidase domain-containing protein [Candidatus Acidoferrum sp.]|nr:penicillin-binding transpeptidase domain-containing protein [Candidatus Acidoferrum sp.]